MEACKGKLDSFCYVCGHFVASLGKQSAKKHKATFSEKIKDTYELYFDRKIDLSVWWVPKTMYKTCYNVLLE